MHHVYIVFISRHYFDIFIHMFVIFTNIFSFS